MSHRNRHRRNTNTGNRQEYISQDRWFDDGGQNDTDFSPQQRTDRGRNGGNGGGYRAAYATDTQRDTNDQHDSNEFAEGVYGGDSSRYYPRYGETGNYSQQRGYSGQGGYGQGGYSGQSSGYIGRGQAGHSSQQQHGFQQSEGTCPECGHSHRGMQERDYHSQGQMSGQPYRSQSGWGQSGGNYGGSHRQGGMSGQGGYDTPFDQNEGGFQQSSRSGSSSRRQSQSDDFGAGYGGNYGGSGNWGSPQSGNRQDNSLDRTGGNVSSDWWSYEGQRSNRAAGKGPKGYKRSDERIKDDVNDRLSDGVIDASEINVNVQNGEVTLTGSVENRRTKFHAETIAEQVLGVTDVNNQLRVTNQMSSSESSRSKTSDSEDKSSPSKSTSKTSSTPMTSGAR